MSSEAEMLAAFSDDARDKYIQWTFAARELSDSLDVYGNLDELNSKTALEEAISELREQRNCYMTKWRVFAETVIHEGGDPSKADSSMQSLKSTTRSRLVTLGGKLKQEERDHVATERGTPRVPVKMPPIQLPTFDGSRVEWEHFWTLFKDLVHDKAELSYSHKYTYLKQCCKGDAKEAIAGFIPNEEGYENAVKLLREQYDGKDIKQHQLQSTLLGIKPPGHNLVELKTFRLEYQKVLRSLMSMSCTQDKELVKTVLFNKLHDQTTKQLVDEIGIKFDYEAFDEQLKKLIQKMEFCRIQRELHEPKPKKAESRVNVNTTVVPSLQQQRGCEFCQEAHAAFKCPTYVSVNQRRDKLRDLRKCMRCGRNGHYAKECRVKLTCYGCKGNHWGALCNKSGPEPTSHGTSQQVATMIAPTVNAAHRTEKPKEKKATETPSKFKARPIETKQVNKCEMKRLDQNGGIALPTATMTILAPYKGRKTVKVRAFFDSGSQCSFIHPDLVKQLGLFTSKPKEMSVVAFGGETQKIYCTTTKVKLSMGYNSVKKVNLIVTDKVAMRLTVPGLQETAANLQAKGIKLADTYDSDVVDQVKIMIGADYFDYFITGLRKVFDVSVFKSPAGHLISGRVYNSKPRRHPETMLNNQVLLVARVTVNNQDCVINDIAPLQHNPDIAKLWELDTIGIDVKRELLTKTENDVLLEFVNTIKKDGNKYEVSLPWKRDPVTLPSNYRIAKGQLGSLISKLKEDPVKHGHYQTIVSNYLEQGFIEEVKDEKIYGHYLPYHGVVKESATTPIRLVFNASSKIKEEVPSLNDMLETGPSLTEKLVDCLVMFRKNEYAVTADISKAFLRVGVNPHDRDYLRFLWVKNLDQPEEISTYRFKVVPFGSTSSPFLLQGTLYKHFQSLDTEYKELLLHAFYVDNFMTTLDDETQLKKLYEEVSKCLLEAGMPLQMWNSNSTDFNNFVNDEMREVQTNVLGLTWDTSNDTLSLKEVSLSKPNWITKRTCLSTVSSLYDPIGLLAPITIVGKLLMRDIWMEKVGWDDKLPDQYAERLGDLIDTYNQLHSVSLPRKCIENGDSLHVFCDASLTSYGCVAYSVNANKSRIIMARSRVAPLSTRTIVQLELTALLLGCRLAQYIVSNVHSYEKVVVWCDNQCCISWMTECKMNDVYVKNRVAEARRLINAFNINIQYVPTDQNPSDILSRGTDLPTLINSNWFEDSSTIHEMFNTTKCSQECIGNDIKSPSVLREQELTKCESLETSEKSVMNVSLHENAIGNIGNGSVLSDVFFIDELKLVQDNMNVLDELFNHNFIEKDESACINVNEVTRQEVILPEVSTVVPIEDYSDLTRLYTVTNYILRGIEKWTHGKCQYPDARIYYLQAAQREHYPYVMECLQHRRQEESFAGSRKFIHDLSLVLDENGLIRSIGRLGHTSSVYLGESPILLPPKSWLCTLLVRRAHERCMHGGMNDTLALLRRTYWIPKGRQTVKKIVERCIQCKHYNAKPFVYPSPPPLPKERVTLDRPFKYSAVDFTGAISVIDEHSGESVKRYICLFSCLATRAIYIETIDSLSAEAFIHCLRRFTARCSLPAKLYSDNGTNFVATNKFIETLENNDEVKAHLEENEIVWQFNVPGAPWQGGNYERLIKIVKSTLQKTLHGRQVTYRELQTLVKEVEATVNNRPLTYIPSDDSEHEILTPSKLLYGRDIYLYPHCVVDDRDYREQVMNTDVLLDYHNNFSKIFLKFKKIWESEYLTSLREKHNFQFQVPPKIPEIGDIVLVKGADKEKLSMGKIVDIWEGKDGLVREVRVLKNGKVSRMTINKLIPLELSQAYIDDHDLPEVKEISGRHRRKAAVNADLARREMIAEGIL